MYDINYSNKKTICLATFWIIILKSQNFYLSKISIAFTNFSFFCSFAGESIYFIDFKCHNQIIESEYKKVCFFWYSEGFASIEEHLNSKVQSL